MKCHCWNRSTCFMNFHRNLKWHCSTSKCSLLSSESGNPTKSDWQLMVSNVRAEKAFSMALPMYLVNSVMITRDCFTPLFGSELQRTCKARSGKERCLVKKHTYVSSILRVTVIVLTNDAPWVCVYDFISLLVTTFWLIKWGLGINVVQQTLCSPVVSWVPDMVFRQELEPRMAMKVPFSSKWVFGWWFCSYMQCSIPHCRYSRCQNKGCIDDCLCCLY